jgi:hypothetical protein
MLFLQAPIHRSVLIFQIHFILVRFFSRIHVNGIYGVQERRVHVCQKKSYTVWPGVIVLLILVISAGGVGLCRRDGIVFRVPGSSAATYQTLDFVEGREVATFRISGHVNLKDEMGEVADCGRNAPACGMPRTGSATRCVWRDADGEGNAAYSVLEGRVVEQGVQVTGRFVGGSGNLKA